MKRRPREITGAIPVRLREFELPTNATFEATWAAWEAFDAEMSAWEEANPDHLDAADEVRARVPIPDEPWDITKI